MNLADVFTYLFVILGFVIVYIGYWLMATALFPRTVERYAEQIGRAPIKTLLLGAVTFIPLVTIAFKAFPGGTKPVGVGLALLVSLGALFGSAGLALRVGQGMSSPRDAQEPWRRVLRGGIVLALTFVMPFIGTFIVMPFAWLSGFGAFVIMLFRRDRQVTEQKILAEAQGPAPVASEPPALSVIAP